MSISALIAVLVAGTALSLVASWLLVFRLERVGARLGFSEGLLGMVAALAADAPEITASVTALAGHQSRIGAGVALGSNVFNLAALLGVAAIVSGGIALHRHVIAFEAAVAVAIGAACLAVVCALIAPIIGLALAAIILGLYLAVLSVTPDRLRRVGVKPNWVAWLTRAVLEEESELEQAIRPARGRGIDGLIAGAALLIVVGASVAMEQAASRLGARARVPQIITGGLVLAGVTSLPNAVAAIYLARRGRGAATLSTAMNSNAINVAAGLLLPAAIVGLASPLGPARLVAGWYVGLTVLSLACAYAAAGRRPAHGVLIVLAYLAFVAVLVADAYSSPIGVALGAGIPALAAIAVAPQLRHPAPAGHAGPAGGAEDDDEARVDD
jgi:cation:H+ antiporter